MLISICITVLNEEGSVRGLLESLINQSKKADEIVVVDGGSTDKTVEITRHLQKKDKRIKLLVENCTRAKGRNLACEIAKGEIIAMTDADCTADVDWLKNITAPFVNKEVDIAAGFYNMSQSSNLQKAMGMFLGVLPNNFNADFLPSTRSIAFKKDVWEQIGGFPDEQKNSAEDTYFNFHALKLGMKYARVKNATVEWRIPKDLKGFFKKIQSYAKWDAETKVLLFPTKGIASHNIKALFVLLRYVFAVLFSAYCLLHATCYPIAMLFFVYSAWALRKVYLATGDWIASLWGPVLQVAADLAVISGFVTGLFCI